MDGIPCVVVRDCARCFKLPLKVIFTSCIVAGVFPEIWKTAKFCPVHQSDINCEVKNYRPISIIPTFAEIFEMLIYDLLLSYFSPFISPSQHGFFTKRSTLTNLLLYTKYLYDSIASGGQSDDIETDFAKAFDKVNIALLIQKLLELELPERLLNILISYLIRRPNRVLFNGYRSYMYISTSGIPQGSNLGPLIFIIFINSLVDAVTCLTELFADDAKYYSLVKSLNDCLFLQENLDSVAAWCRDNRIT